MMATKEFDATAVKAPDTARALEADEINFSYGRLQVLFGVSLYVDAAEALALLGTNGAGKTTLLRVLAVLVPGGRAVFADMTVDENLELQALTVRHRTDWVRQRREEIYDLFPRLAERLRQPAGSLSGGEQQQVALAKAILLDPSVLCIDELSLGLAPIVVQELLEVVRRINATGVAVVLVEQSLNIASELCTRAVFMEKGLVRFEGRPSELLERDDLARAVFLGSSGEGTK
ncbi:MAG: ATP-binding cassette domain-containing protein [Candidatus Rokuibacteriota bacterium]|nr:MAG: ATP-binding cassette domain-containing protein [Candidatus Rokubacteria bacterium]